MTRDLATVFFAIAAGFTLSGIAANLYALFRQRQAELGQGTNLAVLVVAGPSVLIGSAASSLRARKSSAVAFWLAAAVSAYWSFVLGLFLLNLVLAL
jgi:hypothetical protein